MLEGSAAELRQPLKGYNTDIVQAFFSECGLTEPVAEFKFMPERKFRFDFAWPTQKVALECQGGIFARIPGGHNRGAQIRKEHEKRNLAAAAGWRILYCETETICTMETVELIRRSLVMDWRAEHAPAEKHDD